MKKIIGVIVITLFFVGFYSCKKFLDVSPKSQIKEGDLFENEQGFADALTGVYTSMASQDLYGDMLTMKFLEVLAQRYKVDKTTSPYWNMANYNYDQDDVTSTSAISAKTTVSTIYLSMYNGIANANNILAQIDDKKSMFSGNQYEITKGEALGLRGFLHFDLLRMFGPIMSTNPNAISIPYRVDLTKEAQERLPASEVAQLIIKDLLEAEQLLVADPVVTNQASDRYEYTPENRKFRMNLYAVQATLARVYQYTGDNQQAYLYAKKIIDSNHFPFVEQQWAALVSVDFCHDRLYHTEQVFSLFINNLDTYVETYFLADPVEYEGVALNNDNEVIESVFENSSSDYRRQYLWDSSAGKLYNAKFKQSTTVTGGIALPSQCDYPKSVMPILRLSEMYYIAAESTGDINEGMRLLNEVRTHRGLSEFTNLADKTQLQDEITKEYQKEFYSEGQLFYYYKRKNFTSIPFSTVSTVGQNVYVMPIPEDELEFDN